MKRIIPLTVAMLTALSFAVAQQSTVPPEQQVQQANRKFNKAMEQRNLAAFEQCVDENAIFASSHYDGTYTKADVRRLEFGSQDDRITVKNMRILSTQVYGETGVITGRLWISDQEQPNGRYAFTNVFIKVKKDWRLLTTSVTELR